MGKGALLAGLSKSGGQQRSTFRGGKPGTLEVGRHNKGSDEGFPGDCSMFYFHVRAPVQGGSSDPVPHHAGPARAVAEESMGLHTLRIQHQWGGEGEL